MSSRNIATAILFLTIICMIIYRLYNDSGINKNKVYVLGKVYEKGAGAHGSTVCDFYYIFKGHKYISKTSGGISGENNNLIFLKIDSLNPNQHNVLEFTKVPDCITMKDVPYNGWKELPKCK